MKCGIRFRLLTAFVLFIVVLILLAVLEDKFETYDPLSYGLASISRLESHDEKWNLDHNFQYEDKIIVIPAMAHDDTAWVAEELPDWQRAIYLVNPSTTDERTNSLTTPINKGHEAMAYLTYIIDNYNKLIPSIVAFLHSHRDGFFQAWHVDNPLHDNVAAMQNLRLDFVQQSGFVNLRCNWNPGCKKQGQANTHIDIETWDEVFDGTSTPTFRSATGVPAANDGKYKITSSELLTNMYLNIWTPCCAQFVVSKEQIYERPLEDYVKIRQWLMETEKDDAHSGRVLEFLWHIIFGKEAVFCPDENTCYCQVYGRC